MRRVVDGTARIRSLAGAVLLDLNDGTSYRLADFSDDEVQWERTTSESPWVDGDSETNARKVSTSKTVAVRVKGSSWAQVEQRREALIDAAAESFLLEREIEGVSHVWRASRADVSSPMAASDVFNHRRVVYLTIPVQPTAVVTFPEEP